MARYIVAVVVIDSWYDAKTSDPQIPFASDDLLETDDLEEAKRKARIMTDTIEESYG